MPAVFIWKMFVFEPKMDTFSHFLGSGGTPGGHLSKRCANHLQKPPNSSIFGLHFGGHFGVFWYLKNHCFSGGDFFTLFLILVSPGPPKQELFGAILGIFSCLGELVKTTLSPESQHDPAGSRPSQNLLFLMFFEVSNLNGLLAPSFFDFLWFLVILGVPLGTILALFCLPKKPCKTGSQKTGVGGMELDLVAL